jgi:hypothetical protein
MDWLLLAIAAVAASELMLRLPLLPTARALVSVSRRSGKVLASKRISDHWKEKVLPAYSVRMAKASVGFFVLLCAALVPVVLLGFVHSGGIGGWMSLLMRPLSMLWLCAVSIAFIWVRFRVLRA